jgi:lysozyme
MIDALLLQLLKEEEGLTIVARPDAKSYWQIGYGHDLPLNEAGYAGLTWTEEQADHQLALDANEATLSAQKLPGYPQANSIQQVALSSMCYQLGTLAGWPKFAAALADANYPVAAYNALQSEWAQQTPRRAYRESIMLATGQWIPR